MDWLKKLFNTSKTSSSGGSQGHSSLSSSNQQYLNSVRNDHKKMVSILNACHTRQQVIDGLRNIARDFSDMSPVATRAADELDANLTLDAFRIRDDMLRTLENFQSSTRNL